MKLVTFILTLILAMVFANSYAQSPRVIKGAGYTQLVSQVDGPNIEAAGTALLELYHNYPGSPPTFFKITMKVNGAVVHTITIPLPSAPPMVMNVTVHWEVVLPSGHNVVQFFGEPMEQSGFNPASFRFFHEIEVDVP